MTGTLGILLRAKEKGLVQDVLPLIDKLQMAGVWIDANLKTEVLRQAGEAK